MAIAWAAVLLWDGPAPVWLLVVMAFASASGGPASMVGFDLARTFIPVEKIGRANGVVNIGGFLASLLTMAVVGVVLDLREPRGADAYELADFKVALAMQYLFWAFGAFQVLRYRRRALAHLRREHPGAVEAMRSGTPFAHPGTIPDDGV